MSVTFLPLFPGDEDALLALNNAHAEELSFLTIEKFRRMAGEAFMAVRAGESDAYIVAFDEGANYDSPNFLWFRQRFDCFVYVDRICVAPQARGRGLARALYLNLFDAAKAAGHERVVCEVNSDPPNPASDAFHAAMGFAEVGRAKLPGGKQVAYFERRL